jgi:hypothetical protein
VASAATDDVAILSALGLLAYASADVAHHVVGHGGACLVLGGHVVSVSSIFVNCTLRGADVDLAGPLANLVLGLAALFIARSGFVVSSAWKLMWILTAAMNLFWFEAQLVFSAATGTDDWAWAMHVFRVSTPVRVGMIAAGGLAYRMTIRVIARLMSPFGPRGRASRLVWIAWIAGGCLACATAAFDPAPLSAILHDAAPQSLLLPIGILLVPGRVGAIETQPPAAPVTRSLGWVAAALLVAVASILLLGPGFGI